MIANILNIDKNIHDGSYYDLTHNRVTVRGFSYSDMEDAKLLIYPGVLQNIYSISKDGKIYSIINETYISWSMCGQGPYVNLLYMDQGSRTTSLESFLIRDLMAYNYIANASSYLERGCRAANIDGNPLNCNYSNIVYLEPEGYLNKK